MRSRAGLIRLVEAVQELQGHVSKWPVELQLSIWKKSVEMKLPYALASDGPEKNLLKPALRYLDEELPEIYLLVTTSYLAAFKALEGMFLKDVFQKMAFKDFVIEFSHSKGSRDESFGLLAAVVTDTGFYDNLLKDFLEEALAMEVHVPMLNKVEETLKNESVVTQEFASQSKIHLGLIKDMLHLKEDMPDGSM